MKLTWVTDCIMKWNDTLVVPYSSRPYNSKMFVLLILFVVVTSLLVLLYWSSDSCVLTWNCEDLSNKAVLITGCDFNEVARELALLLDKNGVPVFACYSNETNAHELQYDSAVLLCSLYGISFCLFYPIIFLEKRRIGMPQWINYY